MVTGMYWAFSRPGHVHTTQTDSRNANSKSSSKGNSGFMSRMEDRWEKRQRGE